MWWERLCRLRGARQMAKDAEVEERLNNTQLKYIKKINPVLYEQIIESRKANV
jgi:hypothetical protein